MISSIDAIGKRLHGKTIFLSASVPTPKRAERYQRIEDAQFEIEQAVISLARAVFSENGRLVFGGHPAISPLVAMVAGEYREPRYLETGEQRPSPPIRIFQSRAFEGHLPSDTLLMYRLGYATITWVDTAENEKFDPTAESESPCPRSLRAMREAMIRWTKPEAMVCIGGMDGVEREVEMFREFNKNAPIYVLEKTGGASVVLANSRKDVRVIDSEVIGRIDRLKAELFRPRVDVPPHEVRPVVPYPLIMQTIVEEVSQRGARR